MQIQPTTRDNSIQRRLRRPQRHRLLQGYPMEPLMNRDLPHSPTFPGWVEPARPLIVGVIPHPFCNPRVEGCGFCTFPHERFGRSKAVACAEAVAREIDVVGSRSPRRRVEAVYFGGGTANLTPVAQLRRLGVGLTQHFDLRSAEITLEGVPNLFLAHDEERLDWLAELADRGRISMGVQTFDPAWLAKMGRRVFGDEAVVAEVVAAAQNRGLTTSADLLVHLPGQPLAAMLRDIDRAVAIGLDQICIYPLVLFEGLGSAWSRDPDLLAARPRNDEAADAHARLRERLREHGYTPSTLTNFERGPRRFRYEVASFHPERYDAIGFGPGGITCLSNAEQSTKWLNAARADDYVARIEHEGRAVDRHFDLTGIDLQLLQLTRGLCLGGIDRLAYRDRFGADVLDHHGRVLREAVAEGLMRIGSRRIHLTTRGCFYADTVQGALAEQRVASLRHSQMDRRHLDVLGARQPMG